MYTVMVTGGLGSGKSMVCEMLGDHGACSLDLDGIAHNLLENDTQMIGELTDEFGEMILDEAGNIDSKRLAAVAFVDDASAQALDDITHPRIMKVASDYLSDVHCTPPSAAPVQVVEVPLLTQYPDFARLADCVISVTAPSELRLARAIARGMDPLDATRRISLQATDAERNEIADDVIDNSGTSDALREAVDAWWSAHEEAFHG